MTNIYEHSLFQRALGTAIADFKAQYPEANIPDNVSLDYLTAGILSHLLDVHDDQTDQYRKHAVGTAFVMVTITALDDLFYYLLFREDD